MAAVFALAAGPAIRTGVHVRISLLGDRLPTNAGKWLDCAANMVALAVAALLVAALWTKTTTSFERNRFSFAAVVRAGRRAVRTSAMIGLIIIGAALFNAAFGFLGIRKAIDGVIASFGLSPFALIVVLLFFYVLLGMFLDGTSIIVMTLPITLPLVSAAGYDPVWFGVFVVVAVEISQITPPIDFNLFVIQSRTGESIGRIARAALPFFSSCWHLRCYWRCCQILRFGYRARCNSCICRAPSARRRHSQ